MNHCGDERLKAHSSYTWMASLKVEVVWLQAPLSSYRSTKSPHSLVALIFLFLKLPFLLSLFFFFLQDSYPFFLGFFFSPILFPKLSKRSPLNGFIIFPCMCHFLTTPSAHYSDSLMAKPKVMWISKVFHILKLTVVGKHQKMGVYTLLFRLLHSNWGRKMVVNHWVFVCHIG